MFARHEADVSGTGQKTDINLPLSGRRTRFKVGKLMATNTIFNTLVSYTRIEALTKFVPIDAVKE